MGDVATWVGAVVSVASLVVAILALRKSASAQHEANAAQRRIVEMEEEREGERRLRSTQAGLRPELRKTARSTYRLYLVNDGAAEARNILVELDGTPLKEHPAAGEAMPHMVGPHSEISCRLGLHMTCTPPFEIKITWDDASGQNRTYRSTLTW